MVLEGIYVVNEEGEFAFRHVAPPSDAELTRVAERIRHVVSRLLERRGAGPQASPDEADTLQQRQPLLAELYGASLTGRVASGPRTGRRIAIVGGGDDREDLPARCGRRCASVSGFSVHADVRIPAHNRMRLERLARYAGRPPLSTERLSLLPDGRLLYRLKRRWSDGTSHMIFEPVELVERLAALVPPPRVNLVRYFGVLGPAARFRPLVVPEPEATESSPHSGCPARPGIIAAETENDKDEGKSRSRNYSWAQLMARVFEFDVLKCPRCGARMRILAAIHPPDAIEKILICLGLPSRPPPIAAGIPNPDAPDRW
jgi:hypothetical protein